MKKKNSLKKLSIKKEKVISLSNGEMNQLNGGKKETKSTNRNLTCGLCTGDDVISTGGTTFLLLTTTLL